MINVCFAISDKKGTYTKYLGAAICSMFEHTSSWITLHIVHDHTMSTDNRKYLVQLTRRYGHQILFYDIERMYLSRWQELKEKIKPLEKMTKNGTINQAIWYCLMLGELFYGRLDRLICLDADIIVNLDIAELWAEETGRNGLAAVRDTVIQEEHSSRLAKTLSYPEEKYFNSGVMLLDMETFGRQENLLERGTELLLEHKLVDYLAQDIYNYYFGEDCKLLSDRYNTLVSYEMIHKRENLGACIYHYAGQWYALDAVNNYYRLFLDYLCMTPWCNGFFLSNMAGMIHKHTRSLMLGYANFIAGMKRIIIGDEKEKEKLKKMMMLKENEKFYTPKEFDRNGLRLEPDEILIFFIKPEDYANTKRHLEDCGCTEGVHFINGNVFLYRDARQDARILRDS